MANHRRFTIEQEKQAVQMYENGESTKTLAAYFNASEEVVRLTLKKHGVRLRKRSELFIHPVQLAEMKTMYEAGSSIEDVAMAFGLSWHPTQRILIEAGTIIRPAGFRSGEDHHIWNGGRSINGDGYVLCLVHPDSPYFSMGTKKAINHTYVLEHRLVMAQKLGRPLSDSETVHHKDGDRQNNHPDNLELRQGRHGKGGVFRCADCGSHNIVATELAEKN